MKSLKQWFLVLMVNLMVVGFSTGCSNETETEPETEENQTDGAETEDGTETEDGLLKKKPKKLNNRISISNGLNDFSFSPLIPPPFSTLTPI